MLALHEVERGGEELFVHRFHALARQGAGVFDLAVRVGMDYAARPEAFAELRVLGIVRVLRFFFGVEVIEIAEELIETVASGKKLVFIPQVVLPKLPGSVSERLQNVRDAWIFRAQAGIGPGQADFREPGTDGRLPGDERRASGGAALLTIPVRKHRAFFGNTVDVGCLVSHDAAMIDARVEPADVVAHDDEDVGFLLL